MIYEQNLGHVVGASEWRDVENKPFETLDLLNSFEVDEDGKLIAKGGGGDGGFIVAFEIDERTEEIVADKTFRDIMTEISNGTAVLGVCQGVVLTCTPINDNEILFSSIMSTDMRGMNVFLGRAIRMDILDRIDAQIIQSPVVPIDGASDGYVLSISGGELAWVRMDSIAVGRTLRKDEVSGEIDTWVGGYKEIIENRQSIFSFTGRATGDDMPGYFAEEVLRAMSTLAADFPDGARCTFTLDSDTKTPLERECIAEIEPGDHMHIYDPEDCRCDFELLVVGEGKSQYVVSTVPEFIPGRETRIEIYSVTQSEEIVPIEAEYIPLGEGFTVFEGRIYTNIDASINEVYLPSYIQIRSGNIYEDGMNKHSGLNKDDFVDMVDFYIACGTQNDGALKITFNDGEGDVDREFRCKYNYNDASARVQIVDDFESVLFGFWLDIDSNEIFTDCGFLSDGMSYTASFGTMEKNYRPIPISKEWIPVDGQTINYNNNPGEEGIQVVPGLFAPSEHHHYVEQIDELVPTISGITNDIKTVSDDLSTANDAIDALESSISDINTNIGTIEDDITLLQNSKSSTDHTHSDYVQYTDIEDSVASTATNKALSANMGKDLSDRIDNIASRGRFLAVWNCDTGTPTTEPVVEGGVYQYRAGDYYIVGNVGTNNYKPYGNTYTVGGGSLNYRSETTSVSPNDTYLYDGIVWILQASASATSSVSFSNIAGNPTENSGLAAAFNGKADANHTHDDRYYTESEIDNKLDGKAASSHTHDDRYYTESEMDTRLSGKAASSHTHSISNVTDLQTTLNGKAASSHTHDDRYYTESEVDSKLSGKAASSHTHSYAGSSSAGGPANNITYTTSTPTSANTSGLKICVLSSEPATKYSGWIYLIQR